MRTYETYDKGGPILKSLSNRYKMVSQPDGDLMVLGKRALGTCW